MCVKILQPASCPAADGNSVDEVKRFEQIKMTAGAHPSTGRLDAFWI